MSYTVNDKSRVGRSGYWTAFIINIVAVIGLVGGCVVAAVNGRFGLAILLFLLVAPVGIYFRVVMMRRCRDIGWPAALPWILFGAGIVANMSRFAGGLESLRDPGSSALPMLVGLADFAFMIVIGCIAGRDRAADYARHFDTDDSDYSAARTGARPASSGPARMPQAFGEAPQAPMSRDQEEASWDAAIARALEARQRGEGAGDHRPVAPPVQRPAPGIHRPAGGFGRRVV